LYIEQVIFSLVLCCFEIIENAFKIKNSDSLTADQTGSWFYPSESAS